MRSVLYIVWECVRSWINFNGRCRFCYQSVKWDARRFRGILMKQKCLCGNVFFCRAMETRWKYLKKKSLFLKVHNFIFKIQLVKTFLLFIELDLDYFSSLHSKILFFCFKRNSKKNYSRQLEQKLRFENKWE